MPGRRHADLHTKTGLTGLPDMAFLDAEGRWLVRVRPKQRTPKWIAARGANAHTYVKLRSQAAAGDQQAEAGYLILQLQERQLAHAEAVKRRIALKSPPVTPNQFAWLDRLLFELWIHTRLEQVGRKAGARAAAGREFIKLWRAGKRPSAAESRGWWYAILAAAEEAKDLSLFDEAFAQFASDLQRGFPGEPWIERTLDIYRKRRATLAGE